MEEPEGFQVTPRTQMVERASARLPQSRRIARGYERLPETGGAMTRAAVLRIVLQIVASRRGLPFPHGR